MGVFIIALIIVAVWIGILVFVLAVCKASAHADANEERYLAEMRDDVSSQSPAPASNATVSGERKSVDRAELEREAERLRIELPKRPLTRLTRPAGIRRHRS
jgi:hypothetical protein